MSQNEVNALMVVFIGLPAVALVITWLMMVADVIITKGDVLLLAGHDRVFCLLLLIGLGPVGAIIYGISIRPQLARVEHKLAAEQAVRPQRTAPFPPAFQVQ